MLRQPNRYRNWLVTLFTEEDIEIFQSQDSFTLWCNGIERVKFACGQVEAAPETGRLHFQGYFEFENAIRLASVTCRIGYGAHAEHRRGSRDAAITYCSKESSRVSQPVFYPSEGDAVSSQGRRTDIEDGIRAIREEGWRGFIEEHPATFIRYHRGWYAFRYELARLGQVAWRDIEVHLLWGDAGTMAAFSRHTFICVIAFMLSCNVFVSNNFSCSPL